MSSNAFRIHRLQPGDEWVLGQLARGNARFGRGQGEDWLPPLGTADATAFVNDPDTICVVAVELESNQLCGFAYGGVLLRRHTQLKHVCLYEIGIDTDHRTTDVGLRLLEGFGAEARHIGIDRGFIIVSAANEEVVGLMRASGAMTSDHLDLLFGMQF